MFVRSQLRSGFCENQDVVGGTQMKAYSSRYRLLVVAVLGLAAIRMQIVAGQPANGRAAKRICERERERERARATNSFKLVACSSETAAAAKLFPLDRESEKGRIKWGKSRPIG